MNKKIYIGIALLVTGCLSMFILYCFRAKIMAPIVLVISGVVILMHGITEKIESVNGDDTPVHCDSCGKNITYLEKIKIDGNTCCSDCKKVIEQNTKNRHIVCEICGVDLSIENMYLINDVPMCHACFLKEYGEFDCYDEEWIGL